MPNPQGASPATKPSATRTGRRHSASAAPIATAANAGCLTKEQAHIRPRNPHLWPTSANPVRSYTLLNHESPEFIRFVNPGDFRIAHISCGTSGCHPKEVQTNRKQIMSTGCMLWARRRTTTARCR